MRSETSIDVGEHLVKCSSVPVANSSPSCACMHVHGLHQLHAHARVQG